MSVDQRQKNMNWNVQTEKGQFFSDIHYHYCLLAVLMDIRDELRTMNSILGCNNTLAIPGILRNIDSNTRKKRRKK